MRLIDADELEYEILHTDFEIVKHECKDYESYVNGANCFRSKAKNLINKAPTVQVMGEWISVEERLPQENEKVLAINSDSEIFIATYLVHKISPSARGYITWASGFWNGTPTHWMPLPQPPKMKGK